MRRLTFLTTALLLGACATTPAPSGTYAGASVNNKFSGDDRLNALLWMQSSIEHDLVLRQIFLAAEAKLPEALSDRAWDALPKGERTNDATALAPAVIVDVDETVLDNTPFEARMVRDNSQFNETAWTAWVEQKSARALPGALEFAKSAAAHGITVFYLTNRADTLTEATRENLRAQGFPLSGSEETVLGKGANTPGCVAQASNKGCRRKLVAQRYRVLQMFGDQLGDFLDNADADLATRIQLVQPYQAWFGQRWFALPNPDYGSWETAVTHHAADAKLRADPRAAKHAALREN